MFVFIRVARLSYKFRGRRQDGGGNRAMGMAIGRNAGGGARGRVGYTMSPTPNLKLNILVYVARGPPCGGISIPTLSALILFVVVVVVAV